MVVRATDGVVMQRLDYDEFGRVLANSNPGFQPFGFAGGLYDDQTGLIRFGLRDYDPGVGRWTAKDAARFQAGRTNLYVYVSQDPVNKLDPLGYTEFTHGKPSDLVNGLRNALPTIDQVVHQVMPGYDDAVVTSSTGGKHNPGSKHSAGEAIDIRIWADPNPTTSTGEPISAEDAQRLVDELRRQLGDNFRVRNEREHPPGQEVWGGPHIHIERICPSKGAPRPQAPPWQWKTR